MRSNITILRQYYYKLRQNFNDVLKYILEQ